MREVALFLFALLLCWSSVLVALLSGHVAATVTVATVGIPLLVFTVCRMIIRSIREE